MYDICFDVARNEIKKRYGDLTSLNTDQKCLFNFIDPDFIGEDSAIVVLKKDDDTIELDLEQSNGEYYIVFPAVLCKSRGLYSMTIIVYADDSRFRSTQEYTGNILESGYEDENFAPEYPETFLESVKQGILDGIRFTSDGQTLSAEYDPDVIDDVNIDENGEVRVIYEVADS